MANRLDRDVRNLPISYALSVCVLVGALLAAVGAGLWGAPMFEILVNARFLGFSAAYICVYVAAALAGWLVTRSVRPWRTYAFWGALCGILLVAYVHSAGGQALKERSAAQASR
jgi:hypothetical protein